MVDGMDAVPTSEVPQSQLDARMAEMDASLSRLQAIVDELQTRISGTMDLLLAIEVNAGHMSTVEIAAAVDPATASRVAQVADMIKAEPTAPAIPVEGQDGYGQQPLAIIGNGDTAKHISEMDLGR